MSMRIFVAVLMTFMSAGMMLIVNAQSNYDYEWIITPEEELRLAREFYAPFGALTRSQHHAISIHGTLSDSQLMELLGVDRSLFVTYDRRYLEGLSNKELDRLMKPFEEVVFLLQDRYGIGGILGIMRLSEEEDNDCPIFYEHNIFANLRETVIRLLSGEKTFEEWFAGFTSMVIPSIGMMMDMAMQGMVIDGRLSESELLSLRRRQLNPLVLHSYLIELSSYDNVEDYPLMDYEHYVPIAPLQLRHGTRSNIALSVHAPPLFTYSAILDLTATVRVDPLANPVPYFTSRGIFQRWLARGPASTVPLRLSWVGITAGFHYMSADRLRVYVPVTGRLVDSFNPSWQVMLPASTTFHASRW